MKTRFIVPFMTAAVLLLFAFAQAQTTTPPLQHGNHFVDENGDGFNDNAPDADGDGIPNGQDPDYQKPADGTGSGVGKGQAKSDTTRPGSGRGNRVGTKGFVDENGDGLNDNAPDADGDGIPNGQDPDYQRPADGTGIGAGKGKNDSTGLTRGRGRGGRFHGFVDEDGDGINDNLRDADGDGIANCKDSDWVRPMDGTGAKAGQGARGGRGFGKGTPGQTTGNPSTPGGKGPGNQGGHGSAGNKGR